MPCCCFTTSESSKTLELIGTFELIYLVQPTRFTDERVCCVPFLVPRRIETKRLVLRNPYMKKRHEFSVLQWTFFSPRCGEVRPICFNATKSLYHSIHLCILNLLILHLTSLEGMFSSMDIFLKFFWKIVVKFTMLAILKCTVALSTLTMLHSYHHWPIFRTFHHPQQKLFTYETIISHSLLPATLGNIYPLWLACFS